MSEFSISDPGKLPPLSAARRRQLHLKIEKIKKRLGFTGAHLNWPGSLDQRQRARELRIRPLEDPDPHGPWYADIITGKPVENQTDMDALLNDPATTDVTWVTETVTLIVEVFNAFADMYLSIWATRPEPHYEEFGTWLEPIRFQAVEMCRAEWPDRVEWFEQLPLKYAQTEIDTTFESWRSKALDSEIERLETYASGGTGEPQESMPASPETSEAPVAASTAAASPLPLRRKTRSVRINGPRLRQLRLDSGLPSMAAFVKALGSDLKNTTYQVAEGSGRIDITKARLLVDDLNALLRPKAGDPQITFKDLTLPEPE
jgi:hypothetical protein